MKRASRFIKEARRMLASGSFSPFHLSELASAVGTLEAMAGDRRKSRKLIDQSLLKPTENAIAQAEWLSERTGMTATPERIVRLSAEADAWSSFREGNWDRSLEEAFRWLADQPFSSRPAVHGCFIASCVFEDFELAIRFGKFGLQCNPDDFLLRNNLAVAMARANQPEAAIVIMSPIDPKNLIRDRWVVYTATQGLIDFRAGRTVEGRLKYYQAISAAHGSCREKGLIARIYLAMEELRIGSDQAETLRKEALDVGKELDEPHQRNLITRLKNYFPAK